MHYKPVLCLDGMKGNSFVNTLSSITFLPFLHSLLLEKNTHLSPNPWRKNDESWQSVSRKWSTPRPDFYPLLPAMSWCKSEPRNLRSPSAFLSIYSPALQPIASSSLSVPASPVFWASKTNATLPPPHSWRIDVFANKHKERRSDSINENKEEQDDMFSGEQMVVSSVVRIRRSR